MGTHDDKPDEMGTPKVTKGGLKLEAVAEFKRKHQVSAIIISVAQDFDAPLPEDFLIRPLL